MEVLLYCLAGVVLARHGSCQGFCRLLDQPVQADVWFRVSAFGHWCFLQRASTTKKIHVRPTSLNPKPEPPRTCTCASTPGCVPHPWRSSPRCSNHPSQKTLQECHQRGRGSGCSKIRFIGLRIFSYVGLRGEVQDA